MRIGRWTKVIAAAAGLGLAGAGMAISAIRLSLPPLRGKLSLPGLRRETEVYRDPWGIPHIYAHDNHDLFLAQGYVTAQDRLWQMELGRRVASGTLSEVFGSSTDEHDRFLRRLGLRRCAAQEEKELEVETRDAIAAYAMGVSLYIAGRRRRLPLEFRLLRYHPDPWTALDSLAIGKYLGWSLSPNWDTEVLRARLIARLGVEGASAIEPLADGARPLEVPEGMDYGAVDWDIIPHGSAKPEVTVSGGSNAWAIGSEKSATGRPLLANDPHLPPSQPIPWYLVHLNGGDYDVAGASFPGLPGVVGGHNGRIAWGVTVAMADSQDLFVERVDLERAGQYFYRGRWHPAQVVQEEIKIRGKGTVREEVWLTRHGPIISPAISDARFRLALCSSALQTSRTPEAFLGMNRARDWQEFRGALANLASPSLNFIFADREGNIGHQVAGSLPLRAKGDGRFPAPGWTGEYDWQGAIPFEQLPSVYNPSTGYAVSANNRIHSDGGHHSVPGEWAEEFRAQRIVQLLSCKSNLNHSDFAAMQGDLLSLPAQELVPRILQIATADPWHRKAQDTLARWDFNLRADSVAASIYQVFVYRCLRRLLCRGLGDLENHYLGQGSDPMLSPINAFSYQSFSFVARVIAQGEAEEPELMDSELKECLDETIQWLRSRLGDDVRTWRWGRLHKVTFRHVLGQVKLLAPLWNLGPFPIGGDQDTVFQAAVKPPENYGQTQFLPTLRQIIDLGDPDNSRAVLATGQSGQPGSPYYCNMLKTWRSGGYYPLLFTRPAVLATKPDLLLLTPAPIEPKDDQAPTRS